MYNTIDSDVVLTLYFLHSQKTLTFGRLRKIRSIVEEKMKKVHVDVSTPSLMSAVEMHPQLFQWRDRDNGFVCIADRSALVKKESDFRRRLNPDVLQSIQEAVKQACEEK